MKSSSPHDIYRYIFHLTTKMITRISKSIWTKEKGEQSRIWVWISMNLWWNQIPHIICWLFQNGHDARNLDIVFQIIDHYVIISTLDARHFCNLLIKRRIGTNTLWKKSKILCFRTDYLKAGSRHPFFLRWFRSLMRRFQIGTKIRSYHLSASSLSRVLKRSEP